MLVDLFIPCYVDQLQPQIGVATVALLRRYGCQVRYPPDQTCCGQPPWNAGVACEARSLAERFAATFPGRQPIVVPSGSCAAMVKVFYRQLLPEAVWRSLAERTIELSCFLVGQPSRTRLGLRVPRRVGLHHGCHALRELGIAREPRRLLSAVEGLTLVELDLATECCGFGGAFSVDFPEVSVAMSDRKLADAAGQVDVLATTEPSCLLQLDGRRRRVGPDVPVVHIAELLADAEALP